MDGVHKFARFSGSGRWRRPAKARWLAAGLALVLAGGVGMGCAHTPAQAAGHKVSARESKARYEYNRVIRQYQLPAIDATNAVERVAMLDQTAFELEAMVREYAEVPKWAAIALRTLGKIHIERGQLKEGLACFEQVGQRYPQEHWEVIQAWREAGDTLWETHHRGEARLYYRQIVSTYDRPGQPPMFDTIVRVARARLEESNPP